MMDELEQIELILIEAQAFGLRQEVEQSADKYQMEHNGSSRLRAISWAFDEWIK